MSLKTQALSGARWTTISSAALSMLQVVQLAILSRLLDPMAFGLMGMVTVVIGFALGFADMGLSNAIIHKQETNKAQLSSLYCLSLLSGILLFIIILVSAPLVTAFYNEPQLETLLYWVAVIFLITPLGQQFQILLQKELQFNKIAKVEINSSVISTVLTILLAYLGLGVFSLVLGQLIRALVKSVNFMIYGWYIWKPKFYFNFREIKDYLGFGLFQMGERTINYFNSNLDYLVIGSFLGPESLGYYTLAYNLIILPVTKINPIITRVAFPVFSKIKNEGERIKRGYLQVLSALSMINFPLFFGLFAVAPILIPVVFGNQWTSSIVLTQILAGVGLLRSTGNPTGSLILAKGRADIAFKWNLAIMATQVPGILIGIHFGGVIGVAFAYLVLQSLYLIINYLIIIRFFLGSCLKPYVLSMWPYFWMSGVMAAGVWGLSLVLSDIPEKVNMVIQILFGVILYGALIFFFKKSVLSELKALLGRKGAIKKY